MVRVTTRGNTFDINRIVSFGCSFSAGTEILDHKLADHLVRLKETLNPFDWWEEVKKDPVQMALQLELREQERNHAWPAHLASALGVDIANYATPGNSNEHIHWQIEQQLANGSLTENDLVLIGVTSPQRAMFFTEYNNTPVPFLFSNTASYTQALTENILKWFNDDRIVWNYFRDLRAFESAKDRLGGRLFAVHMEQPKREICPWPATYEYGTYNTVSKDNADFLNKIMCQVYDSELYISPKHALYDYNVGNARLPHGHLSETAHKSFAQTLATYCISKVDI